MKKLLVKNIGLLATPEGKSAHRGSEQGKIKFLKDAWVLIEDGVIASVGTGEAPAAEGAEIVVNATPMGLHEGEPSALPPSAFHPGQFVLDIVPTVHFPPTAAAARAAGAEAADGLEFLVGQGAKSFELWTGLVADRAAMLKAIRS